jgi:hypothetical protein
MRRAVRFDRLSAVFVVLLGAWACVSEQHAPDSKRSASSQSDAYVFKSPPGQIIDPGMFAVTLPPTAGQPILYRWGATTYRGDVAFGLATMVYVVDSLRAITPTPPAVGSLHVMLPAPPEIQFRNDVDPALATRARNTLRSVYQTFDRVASAR